jgi:hypothetical protein
MTVAPTRPEAAIAPPSPAEARLAIFDAPASSHLLSRRSLKIGDRTYRLFLATPLEPAPAGGVPILYALDGNAIFDLLDVPLLASVPGLIVAGIGHDTTLRFDPPMRSLDYTPAIDGGGLRPDPDRPDPGSAVPTLCSTGYVECCARRSRKPWPWMRQDERFSAIPSPVSSRSTSC